MLRPAARELTEVARHFTGRLKVVCRAQDASQASAAHFACSGAAPPAAGKPAAAEHWHPRRTQWVVGDPGHLEQPARAGLREAGL